MLTNNKYLYITGNLRLCQLGLDLVYKPGPGYEAFGKNSAAIYLISTTAFILC